MLPLVCIIALDLLLSLITRAALIGQWREREREKRERERKERERERKEREREKREREKRKVLCSLTVNDDLSEELTSESSRAKEVPEEVAERLGQLERFELEFCTDLCPILIQVTHRLLQYAHLFVCSAPSSEGGTSSSSPSSSPAGGAPRQALDVLLCLSGKSLVSPKDKPPYNSHLPAYMNDRLKLWEAALVIDPAQKKKLSMYDDVQVAVCMVNFLNLHYSAFSGTQTYSPARSLKSTIGSVLMILEYMASIFHDHGSPAGGGDGGGAGPTPSSPSPAPSAPRGAHHHPMLLALTSEMVPLSCDVMMEFAHAHLLKFVLSDRDYASSCARGRVEQCLRVLQLAEMRECELTGIILADLFCLLVAMLQDLSQDDGFFEDFFGGEKQASMSESAGAVLGLCLEEVFTFSSSSSLSSTSSSSSSSSSPLPPLLPSSCHRPPATLCSPFHVCRGSHPEPPLHHQRAHLRRANQQQGAGQR